MPRSVETPADLAGLIGEDLVSSGEILVDQAKIDLFLDVSGDRQWIHADPARAARELPGGRTIAPGNLVLALLPRLVQGAYRVERFERCVVAGYREVRFRLPVPAGSRIGGSARVLSVVAAGRLVRVETACRATLLDAGGAALAATVTDVYFP
jgi:acyl dehydratase